MRIYLSSLLFLLYSMITQSAEQINIKNHQYSNITKYTSFYTDETNKMSPDQIDKIINNNLINRNNINKMQSNHNHWFKLILRNNKKVSTTRYLSMEGVFPGNFVYYEKINHIWKKINVFGSSIKSTNKKINSTRATQELNFETGEVKEILLLRQSQHLLSIKVKLESIIHFYQYETRKNATFLFFFGIVIVIFIINILLFLYKKSKTTLSYIFFISSLTFFLAILNGSMDLVYWNISPSLEHHAPFFSSITLFFTTSFLFIFLNIKTKKSYLYQLAYVPPVMAIVYGISYITNLDSLFSIPTGLLADYIITLSVVISIIILIKSNIDKLPGAKLFAISIFIPLLYWLIVELYSKGVSHDSELPMLIGTLLCFTIFNLHSYLDFSKLYNDNQRSSGDVEVSQKYQTIVRMLTHDLATPLMTINASTKQIRRLAHDEVSKKILEKISVNEVILLEYITQMRQKEKESSDLALIANIEKVEAHQLISNSIKNLSFDTKEFNIEHKRSGNFSILIDKEIFYKNIFYPITSFFFPLMSQVDKIIVSCEKEKQYVYIIIKCFSQNEVINMMPNYKEKMAENFNLDLIDSLEDIKQLLMAHKYLNAMGATIKMEKLNKKQDDGISIILSFSS